eukprot:6778267-Lingulodinium_polyedra.AAC.1
MATTSVPASRRTKRLPSQAPVRFSEQPRMRRPVRALPRWPCLEPRSQPNQVPAARARRLLLPGSARGFPNRWRAACKGGHFRGRNRL